MFFAVFGSECISVPENLQAPNSEPLVVPVLFAAALPLWLVSRKTGKLEFEFNFDQTPIPPLILDPTP